MSVAFLKPETQLTSETQLAWRVLRKRLTLDYSHFISKKAEAQQERQIVLGRRGSKWQIEDSSPGPVLKKGL